MTVVIDICCALSLKRCVAWRPGRELEYPNISGSSIVLSTPRESKYSLDSQTPAVSIKHTGKPLNSNQASTVSRVVPGAVSFSDRLFKSGPAKSTVNWRWLCGGGLSSPGSAALAPGQEPARESSAGVAEVQPRHGRTQLAE